MKSHAIITVQFSSGSKQTFVLSDAKANEVCALADALKKQQPQQVRKAAA